MQNHKKKSEKRKHQERITAILESIKQFNELFDPDEIQEELWELFHYSIISPDRNSMDTEDRQRVFFFYDQLRTMLRESAELVKM